MAWVAVVLREMVAARPPFTRYLTACATVGAVTAMVAGAVGRDERTYFALGFLLPLWPMTAWFNSKKAVLADLATWEAWQKAGSIT